MRRLLFSLLAMSLMGTLGCRAVHGVCDCAGDMDSHAYNSPWSSEGSMKTESNAPMPEIREPLPNSPKKL